MKSERKISRNPQTDTNYSWLIMTASFLVQLILFGTMASMGVYYAYFVEVLHWSRSEAASLPSAVFSTNCFMGPLSSFMYYRLGSRRVTVIGGFLFTFGFVSLFLTDLYAHAQIVASFCIVGLGIGVSIAAVFPIIMEYFDKYQHTALTVTTIGNYNFPHLIVLTIILSLRFWFHIGGAFGPLIMPILVQSLLDTYGLRGAALLHGGVALQVVVFGSLMRSTSVFKPAQNSLRNNCKAHLLANQMFFLFGFSCITWGGVQFIHTSLGNTLMIDRGLDARTAALMISVSGGANIIGRVSVSLTAHKAEASRLWLNALSSLAYTIGVFLCTFGHSLATFAIFQSLNGFFFGCMRSFGPSVLVQIFGAELLGAVRGFLVPFLGISGLLAPLLAGYFAEKYNLLVAYYLALVLGLLNFACGVWIAIKSRTWVNNEQEETKAANYESKKMAAEDGYLERDKLTLES